MMPPHVQISPQSRGLRQIFNQNVMELLSSTKFASKSRMPKCDAERSPIRKVFKMKGDSYRLFINKFRLLAHIEKKGVFHANKNTTSFNRLNRHNCHG